MAKSRIESSSHLNYEGWRRSTLALCATFAAGVAISYLIPRIAPERLKMRRRGHAEPVIRHSPYDIEYPPSP